MGARKGAVKPSQMPQEQPTAIPERGEHELTLEGVTYRLRPSHAALRAIEIKTEMATMALIRLGNTGEIPLTSIGIIAAEMIKAGANEKDDLTRNVSAERIGEMIFEDGLTKTMSRLTLCLLDAATGGRTASGEVRAATA